METKSQSPSSATPTGPTPPARKKKALVDRPGLAQSKVNSPKTLPPVRDAMAAKMEADVTNQLKRKMIRMDKAREMGLKESGAPAQNISPGLPKMIFAMGAGVLECPKFNLTNEEASAMAENLQILLPRMDSKIWAAVAIISTIGWKIIECRDAVRARVLGIRKGFSKTPEAGKKVAFDEKTQSMKSK